MRARVVVSSELAISVAVFGADLPPFGGVAIPIQNPRKNKPSQIRQNQGRISIRRICYQANQHWRARLSKNSSKIIEQKRRWKQSRQSDTFRDYSSKNLLKITTSRQLGAELGNILQLDRPIGRKMQSITTKRFTYQQGWFIDQTLFDRNVVTTTSGILELLFQLARAPADDPPPTIAAP